MWSLAVRPQTLPWWVSWLQSCHTKWTTCLLDRVVTRTLVGWKHDFTASTKTQSCCWPCIFFSYFGFFSVFSFYGPRFAAFHAVFLLDIAASNLTCPTSFLFSWFCLFEWWQQLNGMDCRKSSYNGDCMHDTHVLHMITCCGMCLSRTRY